MIVLILVIVCVAFCMFSFINQKNNIRRDIRRKVFEEKQEDLLKLIRNYNEEEGTKN